MTNSAGGKKEERIYSGEECRGTLSKGGSIPKKKETYEIIEPAR